MWMTHRWILCLRVYGLDRVLKSRQSVHTENRTSCTPRFFRSLSIPSQNFEVSLAPTVMLRDFLIAFRCNAQQSHKRPG